MVECQKRTAPRVLSRARFPFTQAGWRSLHHAAHAAHVRHRWHSCCRLVVGLLGHHGFGGDEKAGDGGGILQRRPHHLGGIDDTGLDQVLVALGLGIEADFDVLVLQQLACHNGAVDTGDNNGDGSIDWRDVDAFSELESAPEGPCFEESGPLTDPAATADRAGALYRFRTVVPDGYPLAFSNPLLVDFDGDGFDAPGVN